MASKKEFVDFRDNWLSEEKLSEIVERAKKESDQVSTSFDTVVTFSANFSLLLLAEYHDWLNEL